MTNEHVRMQALQAGLMSRNADSLLVDQLGGRMEQVDCCFHLKQMVTNCTGWSA